MRPRQEISAVSQDINVSALVKRDGALRLSLQRRQPCRDPPDIGPIRLQSGVEFHVV